MWFSSPRTVRRTTTARRPRVEPLEDRCQPNAGVLDPSFGVGGEVAAAVNSKAILVQPWDNRIIVAGSTQVGSSSVMSVARYNADGTLDTTFDGDGILVSNITVGIGAAAALYPQTGTANDGKIVEASGGSVARFGATGGLDTSFGTQGKATLPWSGRIGSVVVQADGKVVVSGVVDSATKTFNVTRLNANGSVDSTFATGGTWQTTLSGVGPTYPVQSTYGYVTMQADGKLLIDYPFAYLSPGYGWSMARLTTTGARDTTFVAPFTAFGSSFNGPDGAALPRGLAVYPATDPINAGKILAVGYTFTVSNGPPGGATVLARYNADGTFDTTFGTGGKVMTPGGGTISGVALQADGKAVLVGASMQRYNTDGTMDTTFGDGGVVAAAYAGLAIQPDGGIDVANSTIVARYLSTDGPPPPAPSTFVSISDVSAVEGNVGPSSMVFTLTLSAAVADEVTVQFQTASGSAQSGGDYQPTGGTVTFAPGETSKTVTVPVIGDRLGEANETFFLNLSNAVNAGYADNQGVGTIVDDEPRISISNVSMTEGNSGTKAFVFTVTLSAAYDQVVTVSYQTTNGTATTGNNDYVAKTGTLTFNPGETQKSITITVNADRKKEVDEEFYVDLTGISSNAVFAKNRGVGTILNDD